MSGAKVAVAGAGRAGTSLLLQVLTDLGLDTGFDAGIPVAQQLTERRPWSIESPKAPRIVSEAGLAHRLGTVLDARAVEVEHVIIPIRRLEIASASRLRSTRYGIRLAQVDSPVRPTRATHQRAALGRELYDLMQTIARYELPHTFLAFPRFARDWRYLADSLAFLDPSLTADRWRVALERRAEAGRIDERKLSRGERILTVAGGAVDTALLRPWRVTRRAVGGAGTLGHRAAGTGTDRPPDLSVYVASINTRFATELCVRTMRHYAGYPFRLTVGDCGSSDGSIEMLQAFEARGWLDLEVAPNGRAHAEWLDRWLATCPTRFAAFVDSDIEFFEHGWLADLVDTARANGVAMVCAQLLPATPRFVHPHTGAKRTLGPRPAPWLLLVDVEAVRGRVDASFAYLDVVDPEAFGGKIGYDVGGAFFAALRDADLGWVEMPESFRTTFRHFSGLSWRKVFDWRAPLRVRPAQLPRMALVRAHLWRARAFGYGRAVAP